MMLRSSIQWFRLVLFVLVVASMLLVPAASRAVTDGVSVFPDNPWPFFTRKGPIETSVTPVMGQPFKDALRVQTRTAAPSVYGDGEYAMTIQISNTLALQEDDMLVAEFWARVVEGPRDGGYTRFVFERNSDPYTKSAFPPILLERKWKRYSYTFTSKETYAPNQAQATFYFGYKPQIVEIGGFSVKSFGRRELPPVTYEGRDANARWRKHAEARIERIRKGNLSVVVTDQQGRAIPNAEVQVRMQRHAFGFGSVANSRWIFDTSTNGEIYRQKLRTLFNQSVPEGETKWNWWDWEEGRETYTFPMIKWLNENGLPVRGHNLIWPSWWMMPDDVAALQNDPAALRRRIDEHILDESSGLRGQVIDWDVINEPYGNFSVMKVLGYDEMARWFKIAKQGDPDAVLYLNENYLMEQYAYGKRQNEFYLDLIRNLQAQGAPVEGMGFQGHFDRALTNPEDLLKVWDRYAALGVRLKVTEFDINITDEQAQADYTRDFLIAAFSHPQMEAVLHWGFWEGSHWLPDAALYREDWSEKPNGAAYRDLVFNKWWTNTNGWTNGAGRYNVRGFLGDYEVTINVNGVTNVIRTSLTREGTQINVRFDPNPPPPPTPTPTPSPIPTPTPIPPGANLLSNGDMENGTANWAAFGSGTLSIDTNAPHGGTQALAISGRTAAWNGPSQNVLGKLTNGKTYEGSVWVRLAPGTNPAYVSYTIKLSGSGSGEQYIGLGGGNATSDGWTEIKGSAPLQWNGVLQEAFIYIEVSEPTASYSIDDAVLKEIAPDPTPTPTP